MLLQKYMCAEGGHCRITRPLRQLLHVHSATSTATDGRESCSAASNVESDDIAEPGVLAVLPGLVAPPSTLTSASGVYTVRAEYFTAAATPSLVRSGV